MNDIYMTNYSVKGIKTLDKLVNLSFYKKTITKDLSDMPKYNVKGIYGMNGTGKSAIVTSVGILKNILTNTEYLTNPIVQKNLESIINKGTEELFIETEYIVNLSNAVILFRYNVTISKDNTGKYVISKESLSFKKATSRNNDMCTVFDVQNGKLKGIYGGTTKAIADEIVEETKNLLSLTSICAIFNEKFINLIVNNSKKAEEMFVFYILSLYIFGKRLHVYLDQSDDHSDYIIENSFKHIEKLEGQAYINNLIKHIVGMEIDHLKIIEAADNVVLINEYNKFEKKICKLYEFIHIFKSDLIDIEIDKRQDKDIFICDLIMVYDEYKINAEFESTGIKKLIKLFAYLNEMIEGSIVFIDEFDANLHDVYLCALLENMMEYGKGQLCFTTHNVGPMDVLKKRKKSIEFLSSNHKIYPWAKNGNYSPSNLYREGMIEGSPFNVDSFDFIGAFTSDEEA